VYQKKDLFKQTWTIITLTNSNNSKMTPQKPNQTKANNCTDNFFTPKPYTSLSPLSSLSLSIALSLSRCSVFLHTSPKLSIIHHSISTTFYNVLDLVPHNSNSSRAHLYLIYLRVFISIFVPRASKLCLVRGLRSKHCID
jgi:hypothetical protein